MSSEERKSSREIREEENRVRLERKRKEETTGEIFIYISIIVYLPFFFSLLLCSSLLLYSFLEMTRIYFSV